MSEQPLKSWGSLCDFCAGSAFPKSAQGLSTGDYPFIKEGHEFGWQRTVHHRVKQLGERRERRRIKAKLHPAGASRFREIGVALTFNRSGAYSGRPTIIDNNMMSAVLAKARLTERFFYHLLCTVDFNTIKPLERLFLI